MNIKSLTIVFALLFLINNAKAQDDDFMFNAFSENSTYVNVGYGVGNLTQSLFKIGEIDDYQFNYKGVGPIFAKYEYGIADNMGVGINVAYAQAQGTYKYTNTLITDGTKLLEETLDWKSYSVLLRFNLHFGDNEHVDPYWGLGAGYRNSTWSGYNNDPQSIYDETRLTNPFNVGFETTFGVRFLFNPNFGAYIEAGIAKAILQFGLTAKF